MNLWNIKEGLYCKELLQLVAGEENTRGLQLKLGQPDFDGGAPLGTISHYFVERYGLDRSCSISPSTGDNPATILALPLRPLDAIVSLGTSTTFLMSTPQYMPDPSVHFFNHPTTSGLYMFMYISFHPEINKRNLLTLTGSATRTVVSLENRSETQLLPLLQTHLHQIHGKPSRKPRLRSHAWVIPTITPMFRSGCTSHAQRSSQTYNQESTDSHTMLRIRHCRPTIRCPRTTPHIAPLTPA